MLKRIIFGILILTSTTNAVLLNGNNLGVWKISINTVFSWGKYVILALVTGALLIIHTIGKNSSPQQSLTHSGEIMVELSTDRVPQLCISNYATNECTLLEQLREAKVRSEALKMELEHLGELRQSLEERCVIMKRAKEELQDRMEETELRYCIESEGLKNELRVCKSELDQVLAEAEVLRNTSSLSKTREGTLADCALRAQTLLTEKLTSLKEEIRKMKEGLNDLKEERDKAVSLAAELAASTFSSEDSSAIGNDEIVMKILSTSACSRERFEYEDHIDNDEISKGILNTHENKFDVFPRFKPGPVTGSEEFRNFLLDLLKEK